jgi:aspartate racemase
LKTIGLIGGMSWESTALYYQIINREVARRKGGLHSALMNLVSLDFQTIADRQKAGDWAGMAGLLSQAAKRLEQGGADCVLIGTNTMHRVAPEVQAAVAVPLLHIADVTAVAIQRAGLGVVGLMGTRFTMEQSFYADRLAAHGISCVIPKADERDEIHRVIFDELCRGIISVSSRAALVQIMKNLQDRGAQGAVLGCTELPLLLGAADSPLPTFDTTELHALAAVDFCLQ